MEDFEKAIVKEIEIQASYLRNDEIKSIYFGGGTPSLLSSKALEIVLNTIHKHYQVNDHIELSLEANPDDLSKEKLQELKSLGINRLSIGTQSFIERDLQFMKRAHNAKEALQSIEFASQLGFSKLSIDLIYGVPKQSEQDWINNLAMLNKLGVNHLSSYALTVEEGTALFQDIKKGKTKALDEASASQHFRILQEWAEQANWEHYEISNLCKSTNYAVHNTSYWKGDYYLGLGPAAHSYNGVSRQWNVANLKKYIEGIKANQPVFDIEHLSLEDRYHEYIMTGLRTQWGIKPSEVKARFPSFYANFEEQLSRVKPSWVHRLADQVVLSKEGRFYADGVASSLFIG